MKELFNTQQAATAAGLNYTGAQQVKDALKRIGVEPAAYTSTTDGRGNKCNRYFYDPKKLTAVQSRRKKELSEQLEKIQKQLQKIA